MERKTSMAIWQDETDEASARGPEKKRIYAEIATRLGEAISSAHIARGTVLIEGPLASQLGCSRAPVRQALKLLEEQGIVSRFDGRGYVAGGPGTSPNRKSQPGAIEGDFLQDRALFAWQILYEDVEKTVVLHSFFGRYRINEVELARHHKVGRTVARDVLLRLASLGILEKDEQLRWSVVPLDDRRIANLYQLRELIEPAGIASATQHMPKPEIDGMLERHRAVLDRYPDIATSELYQLEFDLHVRAVGFCANADLLSALKRTHAVLTLSKHVLGFQWTLSNDDPFVGEHIGILEAMQAGRADAAGAAMHMHIRSSMPKVIGRAAEARETQKPEPCIYIVEGK
ncbi:GntR family transcriptional regulator [Rhizobium sp. KVB221]|uniref:GntR family transcriptional regulator n=1 Tax=Rhizobium setariae TaxID=2801340 RepID=A0A936YQW1_9HYPH|nr:GntR family transcriptional regulator [Rhizobium setariae]MBL0375134.1 GntR family transcriptional regulator [Rhizobium setariae]